MLNRYTVANSRSIERRRSPIIFIVVSLHRSHPQHLIKMHFRPSARIRRQAAQPPSAIINTPDAIAVVAWYRDASLRKMMFWCCCIFMAQICTGFDATLTANFQSFAIWKSGESRLLTGWLSWLTFVQIWANRMLVNWA